MVKQPDPFKKETKWKQWKESMLTYLHSKSGQANIPLAYIVREFDQPNYAKVYTTVHDQLVECAILHGPEYHINNGLVYDLLQSLTVNGPAWAWINAFQRTRDGKNAWKSLIGYYEGDSAKTRSKQECYDSIAKANYQGPRRNFDFSSYVAIHQTTHQDFIRLNKPIPENKKVRDFLNGITDPQCANIKLYVLSNTTYMNDFHEMVNYVASAIDMTTKNTSTSARQISELNRSNNQSNGHGHGRGGRGKGRGRGRGRGSSRGRSKGRGNDNLTVVFRTKSYTAEEWQNLSYGQKQEVYRQRERLATARTVAAMLSENHSNGNSDDVSAVTISTAVNNASTQANQPANTPRMNAQVSLDNVSQAMSRRRTGAYTIIARHLKASKAIVKDEQIKFGRAELDTHADTCGLNEVARILEYTGQVAEVSGFANSMQSIQDVPIVKAAVAYDDPITGETFVIIINQALYFGNQIDEILLNPNQIREYGHIVNDVPKHLGGSTHSIISSDQQIDIPLKLRGIISYFPVRTPTLQEIENCINLILTSDKEWQPYSDDFQQEERKHEYYDLKAVKKDLFLSHKELSNRWAIPEATAKQTLQVTTQTFIRNVQLPIERRSRTKNVMLKYNRLKCRMYSNTFFSNIVSIQGHKCGQLFTTDFGYCRFVPMKTKSDAGYALQDVLHDSGIPNHIHTDGAKELVQGKWKDIYRDANIEMTQTEPHSPWQNRTEIEIRELKRHAKRFMARTKTPSPLWDYCCQYTTELRNHLARPLPHIR